MIDANTMNDLLASRTFRAFLAARAKGVGTDTPSQHAAACRVTAQIVVVSRRRVGWRYNMAAAWLLQYTNEYLAEYGELEPPHLPKGHEQFQSV